MFHIGDRVIVVAPEFDEFYTSRGLGIPVGTTGVIRRIEDTATYEPTGAYCHIVRCIFDLPYKGESGYQNEGGLVSFEVFEPMLAPYDEPWDLSASEEAFAAFLQM